MFSLEFNPIPVSVLRDSPLHRLNVYNKVCFIIMSVLVDYNPNIILVHRVIRLSILLYPYTDPLLS